MPVMPLVERKLDNSTYRYGDRGKSYKARSRSKQDDKDSNHNGCDSREKCSRQKQNHDSQQSINNKNISSSTDKKENHSKYKTQPSNCKKNRGSTHDLDHSFNTYRRGRGFDDNNDAHRNDDYGHIMCKKWSTLCHGRYEVISKHLLGEGTFGRVFECLDRKYGDIVAVKVVRCIEKYTDAAVEEAKILKKIARENCDKKHKVISIRKKFWHIDHCCLAFPKYGLSVFDYLKKNKYQPYKMVQVQHMAKQLLGAVQFIHSLKITHADLKPENLLLENSSYTKVINLKTSSSYRLLQDSNIQLIDFGSATYDDEHHSSKIQTRHYRAPEVILELGWDNSCDLWSCGCIVFELFNGDTLFRTHRNTEHLTMMEVLLGEFPEDFIKKSILRTQYFTSENKVDFGDRSFLSDIIQELKCYMQPSNEKPIEHLHDLIKKLLEINPKNRISAADALKHPFFELDLKDYHRLSLSNP